MSAEMAMAPTAVQSAGPAVLDVNTLDTVIDTDSGLVHSGAEYSG